MYHMAYRQLLLSQAGLPLLEGIEKNYFHVNVRLLPTSSLIVITISDFLDTDGMKCR